jgi:hypothetical protein
MGDRVTGPDTDTALQSYVRVAAGLRDALHLADVVASYGDARSAAEYVVGALNDLCSDLRSLAALLRKPE